MDVMLIFGGCKSKIHKIMDGDFYYCQYQIENDEWCDVQCDHCREYYKPLEESKKREIMDGDTQPISRPKSKTDPH